MANARSLPASLVPLLLVLPAAMAPASDDTDRSWPVWIGPRGDGISLETAWSSAGKQGDVWRAQVGLGYSSVTLADGKLYTKGFDQEGELDVVWCLDAKTGEELWAHAYPAQILAKYHGGGTLSTPTVDGDDVFVLNREGRLHRLDAATGEVRWEKALADEHELEAPTWGFAASPLVAGDVLLVNVGPILAYGKEKGELLWKTKDYGHAYGTPLLCTLRGKPSLAFVNGQGLALIELDGGKEIATHPWTTKYDVNAATPIVIGGDGADGARIFISSGYNHGCALLRLTGAGLEVEWESKEMRNQMSGSVLVDGHLYGFDEEVLKCIGLDGKPKWEMRDIRAGALMAAGDRLIVVGHEGELIVAKASPASFEELSRHDVLEGGVCWTRPVLLEGLIYLRNSLGELVCRDHRG